MNRLIFGYLKFVIMRIKSEFKRKVMKKIIAGICLLFFPLWVMADQADVNVTKLSESNISMKHVDSNITRIPVKEVSHEEAKKNLEAVKKNPKAFDRASRVVPKSKTVFSVTRDSGEVYDMDLLGKNFIVVSLREKGADGLLYAVDKDGVVWWTASISSGRMGYETPSSIYPLLFKKKEHSSEENPSRSGRNNMDYSLWFTYRGHAIHLGNPNAPSHGCIHVGWQGATALFDWADLETKIVITRERYLPFVVDDLAKSGYKASDAPARIQTYLKTLKHEKKKELEAELNMENNGSSLDVF